MIVGFQLFSNHILFGTSTLVFLSALPYMAQIILYGNINHYAYVCVQDELHRTIRYRQVFVQDNHLLAMANDSPTSPEGTKNLAMNVLCISHFANLKF